MQKMIPDCVDVLDNYSIMLTEAAMVIFDSGLC